MKHIVFCTDNNYVMPCGITIISLLEHNIGTDITIHIIGMNLNDISKTSLKDIAENRGAIIYFYNIDKAYLDEFNLVMDGPKHINISTYIRLFAPEILPVDVDKILYLDCDLIIVGNLSELWNTDIENYSVAGVIDAPTFRSVTYQRLNYSSECSYINAGVLLINLKYWRDNNVQSKLLKYVADNSANIVYHDQDVINGVLHDTALLLPLKYNMHHFFYLRKWNAYDYHEEMLEARNNPVIVHFSTGNKPWVKGSFHPYTEKYQEYKTLSPWKDEPIGWGNLGFNKKLKYYKRVILYSLGLKKPKYI